MGDKETLTASLDDRRDDAQAQPDRTEHLRLASILDQMPVGIGIFDQGGQLFHCNRHFEAAAGGPIPSIDAMNDPHWRALTEDGLVIDKRDYPGLRALNGQVATPGIDFIRRQADGSEHWVAVSAVPLTQKEAGSVVGAVVVVEEAGQRRRHVEQLRAREVRFRRFAKYSSNALWIANLASGEIEFLSPLASKIWSHSRNVITLDDWCQSVHHDDLQRAVNCRRLVAEGLVQRFKYRIVDERGDVVRHVRETSFLIPGEDGDQEDCIGGIVEDISPEMQIYLVQPNSQSGDLLTALRQSALRIKTFSSQENLMNVAEVLNAGCVIVDLRHQEPGQLDLHAVLKHKPADLQVVFVGAPGTSVSHAMDAMRAGAVDYLIEPLAEGDLARAIQKACDALPSRHDIESVERSQLADRVATLPRREREVFQGLALAGTNKTIARQLGISPRTVEVHRAHLMERLNVRNLSELLRLAHQIGLGGEKKSASDGGRNRG